MLRLRFANLEALKRIYSAIRAGQLWRSRCNRGHYDVLEESNVSTVIRLRELRRAGRVMWTEKIEIPNRVLITGSSKRSGVLKTKLG
jgi:hypothetical protein